MTLQREDGSIEAINSRFHVSQSMIGCPRCPSLGAVALWGSSGAIVSIGRSLQDPHARLWSFLSGVSSHKRYNNCVRGGPNASSLLQWHEQLQTSQSTIWFFWFYITRQKHKKKLLQQQQLQHQHTSPLGSLHTKTTAVWDQPSSNIQERNWRSTAKHSCQKSFPACSSPHHRKYLFTQTFSHPRDRQHNTERCGHRNEKISTTSITITLITIIQHFTITTNIFITALITTVMMKTTMTRHLCSSLHSITNPPFLTTRPHPTLPTPTPLTTTLPLLFFTTTTATIATIATIGNVITSHYRSKKLQQRQRWRFVQR